MTRPISSTVGQCSFRSCSNDLYARGLCYAHYRSALKYVVKGKATWPRLARELVRNDAGTWTEVLWRSARKGTKP